MVELAAQLLAVNVELKEDMAGREGHGIHFARIPSSDDVAAAVGLFLDLVDDLLDLVDTSAISCPPLAPLCTIDGTQLPFLVCPLIPYTDCVFLEVADVGITPQKPEQLVNEGFKVDAFSGQQREAVGQVKTSLSPKNGEGIDTRSVLMQMALSQY